MDSLHFLVFSSLHFNFNFNWDFGFGSLSLFVLGLDSSVVVAQSPKCPAFASSLCFWVWGGSTPLILMGPWWIPQGFTPSFAFAFLPCWFPLCFLVPLADKQPELLVFACCPRPLASAGWSRVHGSAPRPFLPTFTISFQISGGAGEHHHGYNASLAFLRP